MSDIITPESEKWEYPFNPVFLNDVRDLDDLWFQSLYNIFKYGRERPIQHGSYADHESSKKDSDEEPPRRLQFDWFGAYIRNPGSQIIPIVDKSIGVPPSTTMEYLQDYMLYLMTGDKKEHEDYTYGERLSDFVFRYTDKNGKLIEISTGINQIQEIIDTYKKYGPHNNQMTMEIGMPSDIKLIDPPCIRVVDTKVIKNKLYFFVYVRSWDLHAGLPSNLGGLQLLKKYMADEIGIEDGGMVAQSAGLHLYSYSYEMAAILIKSSLEKCLMQIPEVTQHSLDKLIELSKKSEERKLEDFLRPLILPDPERCIKVA